MRVKIKRITPFNASHCTKLIQVFNDKIKNNYYNNIIYFFYLHVCIKYIKLKIFKSTKGFFFNSQKHSILKSRGFYHRSEYYELKISSIHIVLLRIF